MYLALAIGAAAERARFLPSTLFIFLWTTLVYDVLACWTWNPNGWSLNMGGIIFEITFNPKLRIKMFLILGLDFAGGTPVHIAR